MTTSTKDKLLALKDAFDNDTVNFTNWERDFVSTVIQNSYLANPARVSPKQLAIIDRIVGQYQLLAMDKHGFDQKNYDD